MSLELVERTAEALCTCVVDDVHLSNRFGELLQALSSSLRNRVGRMAPSESAFSRHMTPGANNNMPPPPPSFPMYEPMPPDVNVSMPESYERSMDGHPDHHHPMMPPPNTPTPFNGNHPTPVSMSTSSCGAEIPGYAPPPLNLMGVWDGTQSMSQDPLMSFAGLGSNTLGWSGGQDFFDMLGPLLDVQYEQYR